MAHDKGPKKGRKCWIVKYKRGGERIHLGRFDGAKCEKALLKAGIEQTLLKGGSTSAARARREFIIALGDKYPPL